MSKKQYAHFTLDGRPICECSALAYGERFKAAGSPPCEDAFVKQSGRLPLLQRQFPQRILLVTGLCPVMKESAHGTPSEQEPATLDSASIAATILKQRNSYAPHWDPNLFRAMDDSANAFADAMNLSEADRAPFLLACGVQS